MRTNIVLDEKLVARAMKKAGAKTMRETIHIALREYVSEPDYDGLLALAGANLIDPDYDPKAGYPPVAIVQEPPTRYRARRTRYRAARPK
ncbi:MAG: type II toxin-antitoxin system VapB family antitoxin [Gammaproteobacteria bacterium]|nr:type II toxin-antitoxin system VapB family antitoxin [Gammaproteobacteria bacterium]